MPKLRSQRTHWNWPPLQALVIGVLLDSVLLRFLPLAAPPPSGDKLVGLKLTSPSESSSLPATLEEKEEIIVETNFERGWFT